MMRLSSFLPSPSFSAISFFWLLLAVLRLHRPADAFTVTTQVSSTLRVSPYPLFCSAVASEIQGQGQEEKRDDDEDDDDYLPLTPNQIKTLRKEISKRQARKQLSTVFLSDDETHGVGLTEETMEKIADSLKEHDLVQIRNISKGRPNKVYSISDRLEAELSHYMEREVERIFSKGHATVFFLRDNNIELRTSYVPNAWKKRSKPLRDHRGQIIKDTPKV